MSSEIFHFSINQGFDLLDNRYRGFSLESSTLGATFVIISLINIELLKNKYLKTLVFFLTLIISIFILESKALIPILIFLIGFLTILKYKIYGFILLTAIFVLVMIGGESVIGVIDDIVYSPFRADIASSTSVVTRVSTILASLDILLSNPFGVGFTGYIPAFLNSLSSSTTLITGLFDIPINTNEVDEYLRQNNFTAVGAKSFFFENIIIWGFPFIIFWFYLNLKLISALIILRKFNLAILCFYCFISLNFYTNIVNMYVYAIAYGLMFNILGTNPIWNYLNFFNNGKQNERM